MGPARKSNGVKKKIAKQKKVILRDSTLLKGIKQGVGMVVRRPFQAGRSRPRRRPTRKSNKLALCALNNHHLALPRAVGSYTVTKTTTIIETEDVCVLFGCFKGNRNNYADASWLDLIAVSSVARGSQIKAENNAKFYIDDGLGSSGFDGCRIVPAAMTVQVMCPENMQNADGIAYIGRTKEVLDIMGDSRSWNTLFAKLTAFSAPRLCSAGKLALRGVKVDAIPYNMSQLSDFTTRGVITGDGGGTKTTTWDQGTFEANFEGLAPIFVYNLGGIKLQYLVTVEWRTRFDPGNPAYAGHSYHPVATDSCWNEVVNSMENEGHGVVDMAEGVVDLGYAAAEGLGSLM